MIHKFFMNKSLRFLTFNLVVFGALQMHAQNFISSSTNTSVGDPNCVTVADVNGDGRLDLISSDYGDSAVLVFTNKGGGTFATAVSYKVGANPLWVTAADVNRDGKVDLISANPSDNTLTLLTNNGGGIFSSNATYTVGSSPRSVITADIDGSGRLALISANYNGNSLTVLTNNGNNIYGSNATCNVGLNPVSVTAVDINGNGRPALVCANFSANTITIFTNNGSGVFGSNATLTASIANDAPYNVTAADIYGNGHPALVIADYYAHGLLVLTNNGSGRFSSNSFLNTGLTVTYGAAADMNGDGKVDLLATENYGDVIAVFTNNGSGILSSNASFGVPFYAVDVVAADVNNDGKLDLITADYLDNTLCVLTNAGVFPAPASTPALAIKRSGKGMLVSWPSASAGWSLQQSANLANKTWAPGGYEGFDLSDNGTTKSLFVTPPLGNLFFRLQHP